MIGPVISGGLKRVTRVRSERLSTSSNTVVQNAKPGALAITALHARRLFAFVSRGSTTACACGSWPTKHEARARHRFSSSVFRRDGTDASAPA
jgi:hypothetical protein